MAAIAAKNRFEALLPPWTTNEYAFESFKLSNAPGNVSISGNSTAFSANLDCDTLHYSSEVVRDWHMDNYTDPYLDLAPVNVFRGMTAVVRLIPNVDDMTRIGCSVPSSYYPRVIFPRPSDPSIRVQPAAWLNVTSCSNVDDERLTFTIMELLNQDSQSIVQSNISFRTTALLCKPKFSLSVVELAVNASTAELVDIKLLSNTSVPVALGINTTMLSVAINRPAAAVLLYDGSNDTLNGYWDHVTIPDSQWEYLMTTGTLLPYFERVCVDPWFSIVTNGNASKLQQYSANMSSLGDESSQLFRSMLAQIVNADFRVTDSTPISGLVDRREPKIILHVSSLRCLQIVLGFLGGVAICCVTILRPKCCLVEDPGTLAAVAVLVAASDEFENHFSSLSQLNSRDIQRALQGVEVRLAGTGRAKPVIQMAQWNNTDPSNGHNTQDQGYRPVTLYPLFRFFLIVVALGILSALGTVLRLSDSKQGFNARETVTSLAWSYTPSAVLVILGYDIQGTDSSAQSLRPYISLQRGSVSGKDGILIKVDDYKLDKKNTNESVILTPKAIAGYSCTRNLNKVNVNATYSRAVQRDVHGITLLPAAITSFDRRSISTANNLPPYRASNVSMNIPNYCVSMSNNTCGTSSAWITPDWEIVVINETSEMLNSWGSDVDWGNLLAATQLQHQDRDTVFLERLFDPDYLPDAARSAYISYTAQFINQLRKLALRHGNDTIERTATISEQTNRVFQSRNITIALIVLLSVTIGCVIVSIWGVPRKPIIARAPNSIAAQVSLLVGSELVRKLREKRVESVKDTKIWNKEVFSLGWWSSEGPNMETERKERWGVDIGAARLRNTLDKALIMPS
ncbi:MAG: hypothetical protein Q9195_002853 [Heterodermia aff. obscurata]